MRVLTIGRHPDNNVVINDPTVGRHHAQIIQHDDGHLSILDMNSTNGTYVNGKRIYGEVRINPKDIISLGKSTLSWKSYFSSAVQSSSNSEKGNTLGVILGIAAGILVTFLSIALLFGKVYTASNNIDTQIVVIFSDDISDNYARLWLRLHGARILDSNELYNYYFVCTRNVKSARRLLVRMERCRYVSSSIRNQYADPCSVSMTVVDNFSDPMSETEKISHGEMVAKTMNSGGDFSPVKYNVKEDVEAVSLHELSEGFMDACDRMSDDDLNIVNFSWGVSKYKDKKKTIEKTREDYFDDYANNLRLYVDFAKQCNKNNFIITKSMGNAGMSGIDDAFETALKRMDPIQRQVLNDHFVIVAAKDTRRGFDYGYSNTMSRKISGVNTIMVDLSDLPREQRGTSAAAPLVANWIAKSGFKKASDVIDVVNDVTKSGELVSEKQFKTSSEKLIKQKNYQESSNRSSNSGNENYQSNEIIIEGILRMYVLDPSGNVKIKTSTYDLDDTDDYIAFVVEADQPIDVTSFVDPNADELLDDKKQSKFMIVSNDNGSKRKFASNYAYKRVRVTGTLYVPGAGWQNATEVVMNLKSIDLYPKENIIQMSIPEEEHAQLNTASSIPANLVGTKWVYEDRYAAEKRTIIFLRSNEAKIVDEDINIWTDRRPPVIHTYNCYYNSATRRVIIKRKSDMVIPHVWMQFRFERGMMIEDTNPNVEVEYERAN